MTHAITIEGRVWQIDDAIVTAGPQSRVPGQHNFTGYRWLPQFHVAIEFVEIVPNASAPSVILGLEVGKVTWAGELVAERGGFAVPTPTAEDVARGYGGPGTKWCVDSGRPIVVAYGGEDVTAHLRWEDPSRKDPIPDDIAVVFHYRRIT